MIVTTDDIVVDFIHRFPKVPQHTIGDLIRYWHYRCPIGDFLTAVLSNDLMEAFARADEYNVVAMLEICKFIHCEMPHDCHGSPEKVKAWLDRTN